MTSNRSVKSDNIILIMLILLLSSTLPLCENSFGKKRLSGGQCSPFVKPLTYVVSLLREYILQISNIIL